MPNNILQIINSTSYFPEIKNIVQISGICEGHHIVDLYRTVYVCKECKVLVCCYCKGKNVCVSCSGKQKSNFMRICGKCENIVSNGCGIYAGYKFLCINCIA